MDFRVAEVRFEPVDADDEAIGYVTPSPFELGFRIGDGEVSQQSEPIELPSPGRYEVTLRVEPSTSSRARAPSVAFSGYFPVDSSSCRNPRHVASGGDSQDGQPIPVPYEPDRRAETRSASPSHWGDFSYRSTDSYRYSLGDVEMARGVQVLAFTFDVGEWGREMKRPIGRALEQRDCPELDGPSGSSAPGRHRGGHEPLSVDVTDEVDQFGEGPEEMEDHLSVRTRSTHDVSSDMIEK
jgi:hypothetical protein